MSSIGVIRLQFVIPNNQDEFDTLFNQVIRDIRDNMHQNFPINTKIKNKLSYQEYKEKILKTLNYNKDDTCSICLDSFGKRVIVKTNCDHCFHSLCLKQWLTKNNKQCPYCRKEQ